MSAERFNLYQIPGQLSMRPHCRVEEGLLQEYRPLKNLFHYYQNPRGENDLILFQGTEPTMNWQGYAEAILEVAREFAVSRIYMLGGVLDATPHTREPLVSCVCSNPALRDELRDCGIKPINYLGPGGIRTKLVFMCQRIPIEMAVLHVGVTYYRKFNVMVAHNPKSIRALVKTLDRLMHLGLNLNNLDQETAAFEMQMGYLALQNREFRDYIEKLEKDYSLFNGETAQEIAAHEAVQAVEELLRDSADDEE